MKNNFTAVAIRIFTFCGLAVLFSCTAGKNTSDKKNNYAAGPSAIIYKTKNNYYDKIPVTLNEGYLLDNRGITKNTAFLNITYEEYSKKAETPSSSEMLNLIIDKEPFLEIYDCGNRYQFKNAVEELNAAISNKELNKFKKIF